ncbi:uncharacterized protein V1518DRAFT_426819 [Limtongia smithiae]|uniref:uncharacterized protein n=1 Tax=Limtongia smithiae TaxID=1125753 RepID=UPI0034CF9F44
MALFSRAAFPPQPPSWQSGIGPEGEWRSMLFDGLNPPPPPGRGPPPLGGGGPPPRGGMAPPDAPLDGGTRPDFGGDIHDVLPKCMYLNERSLPRIVNMPFIAVLLALIVFGVVRRLERRRPRRSYVLDVARQLLAEVTAAALFAMILLSSFHEQDYENPMLCRVPIALLFLDTAIGLPLLWAVHHGVYALARLAAFGHLSHLSDDDIQKRGLRSGVYGSPPRFALFARQTALLALAYIFTKFATAAIVYSIPSLTLFIVHAMVGWVWPLGSGAELLMARVVYPVLFWSIQYIAIDRMVRHTPRRSRKTNMDMQDGDRLNSLESYAYRDYTNPTDVSDASDYEEEEEIGELQQQQQLPIGEENAIELSPILRTESILSDDESRVLSSDSDSISFSSATSSSVLAPSSVSSLSTTRSCNAHAHTATDDDVSSAARSTRPLSSTPPHAPPSFPFSLQNTTFAQRSILTTLLMAPPSQLLLPSIRSVSSSADASFLSPTLSDVTSLETSSSSISSLQLSLPQDPPAQYEFAAEDLITDEELPTYADSQRQALESRERDRQRIMDMKQLPQLPQEPVDSQ